ncbi:MAG: hypothetical protein DYG89_09400 [Caldilinea sp. CFX5]|nr:hypothetical protein [Caldilinea sp. CFX5]
MHNYVWRGGWLLLFVVGLFIISGSVNWGNEAANAYLRSRGGSMDAAQFTVILQESITAYRWIGGIVALVSGFGFVRTMAL